MDKRFSIGWVLAFSVLAAYLLLASLLTGGAALPAGVLLLVLVLWFCVYKFRHKGLGNRELATKMYRDLEEALEGIKEKIAQEEARRRATAEHEEQTRIEREKRRIEGKRRKANRPTRDPTISSAYAHVIENRVKECGRTRQSPEGQ
jgi:ABC-type transport system involved in cytochrome bd biosynthesis fused ATPase/permease subunit